MIIWMTILKREMNHGKIESNKADTETEDPDAVSGSDPEELAGNKRNNRGIDRGKPWLRKDQEG